MIKINSQHPSNPFGTKLLHAVPWYATANMENSFHHSFHCGGMAKTAALRNMDATDVMWGWKPVI